MFLLHWTINWNCIVLLHLHQQFFELQCFIAYESKTYLQCFIVLHWKLFCRVDTTMLEFQSKYFPCIKQASRFAMFHCTWIEPCLAGLACTLSSLSNYIRLPHFMCCSVCRTMFDSAYTYNDKNLKLTSLIMDRRTRPIGLLTMKCRKSYLCWSQ